MKAKLIRIGATAVLLAATLLLSMPQPAKAATCTSQGNGNWTEISWSCSHVRANGDSVTIAAGRTVTLNTDAANLAGLTINGTGSLDANGFNITLTGDWTNDGGTFTPGTGTVTFNGSSTQTISASEGDSK